MTLARTCDRLGKRVLVSTATAVIALSCSGCHEPLLTTGAVVVGATYLGVQAPTTDLQQVYYVGIFDPQGQLPPMVYRFSVKGQASFWSSTQFASGWVQAAMVDSLNESMEFDKDGRLVVRDRDDTAIPFQTGRRLIMFGPEGFRESPKDHRLVIVMGSSPDKYFEEIGKQMRLLSGEAQSADERARGESMKVALHDLNQQLKRMQALSNELQEEVKE